MRFEFGPDQLTCSMRDASGERVFSVDYQAIQVPKPSTLVHNNDIFVRNLMLVPIGLWIAAAAGTRFNSTVATASGVLATVIFIALFIARTLHLFSIKYTMLHMAPAPAAAGGHAIRIIVGNGHDAVLAETRTRWKERMRRVFGAVDPRRDPREELAKFSQLKAWGIITEEECEAAAAALEEESPRPATRVAARALN